jgi:ADP-ribose pyrophosphatase YjhB (NUDIX family)
MINKRKLIFQQNLINMLVEHNGYDDQEKFYIEKSLPFVKIQPKCTDRDNLAGHVTASSWILSPNKDQVLLINHRRIGDWSQPGGHIEIIDPSIQAAAKRSAEEETDLENLILVSENLFDVDLHIIQETEDEPKHWHIDLRFIFICSSMPTSLHLTSNNLAWFNLDDIITTSKKASLVRMAKKAVLFFEDNAQRKIACQ